MTKGEQIFSIISRMSKEDKRYFKLYVSRYNNSKNQSTIQLFDILAALEAYDEEIVIAKTSRKKIKNLPLVKFELEKQLLKSYTDHKFNYSSPLYSYDILEKANIGFQLKIPNLALEWIEKGKKHEAYKEDLCFQLLLKQLEFKIYKGEFRENLEKITPLLEESLIELQQLKIQLEIQKLEAEAIGLYKKRIELSPKELESGILSIMNNVLFNEKEIDLKQEAQRSLFIVKAVCYRLLQNGEKHIEYCKKILETNSLKQGVNQQYLSDYRNLLSQLLNYNRLVEFDELMNDFRKTESTSFFSDAAFIQYKLSNLFLSSIRASKSRDLPMLLELLPEIKKYYFNQKSLSYVAQSELLYYIFIEMFFYHKQYMNALDWVERYYQESKRLRSDLEFTIRVYEIVLHFELGNKRLCKTLFARFPYYRKKSPTELEEADAFLFLLKNVINPLKRKNVKKIEEKRMVLQEEKSNSLYPQMLRAWIIAKSKS